MHEIPLPGAEVKARELRWEVVSTLPMGAQTMYRLRGLESEVKGKEVDILVPFEEVTPLISEIQPEKATTLMNWMVYHQAFLLEQALGPDALLAVQPGRIKIEPYQIVPVMRAIRMSRPRLLCCDDVGLGKTIQASLVITELMARRMAHRILIVSPAGPLLDQWKTELWERFGLRVEHIDRTKIEEIRKQTELGANPFDHVQLGIVSVDFLKQERIMDLIERTSYDIICIDEAHHCFNLGKGQDREDSQRRKLAEILAQKCDSLLLLTATPDDGHEGSFAFASLVELLDPSLVDGRGRLRDERYKGYVVRRLKKHIKDHVTGEPKFKDRVVTPIAVRPTKKHMPNFVDMQKALLDLIAPELRRAFRTKNYSDVLSLISLLKRSVSTVASCHKTLETVYNRFSGVLSQEEESQESRRQRRKTLRDYNRKLEKFGTISHEEEEEQLDLEATDLAQQLVQAEREIKKGQREIKKYGSVVDAIKDILVLAKAAKAEDPKISRLAEEIGKIREEEPRANIIVFTEYTDSQDAIVEALKGKCSGKILKISGDDPENERKKITNLFRNNDNQILVSTDASAEGLNLHQRCHHLIHFELPFNPNKLEQRNGRIDRYGQKENPIIRYLYLKGTFEERILLRLIAKYERQRSVLTFVPNTLGLTTSTDASQEKLLKGLMDEDTRLFEEEDKEFDFYNPDEGNADDPAVGDLLEEIDKSLRGFEKASKTSAWLGDNGLNAEQRLSTEANDAREKGSKINNVDIVKFVLQAVQADNGDYKEEGEIITIKLPMGWEYGLDDLPGYDATTKQLRLTTNIETTHDENENTVGFLGRAHPLVRRALDRVRNISFGSGENQGQDRRASAVKAAVKEPHILHTYLGRVWSGAGREYEQVIAVLANQSGVVETYTTADGWEKFIKQKKAIKTTDVWKNSFEKWGKTEKDISGEEANKVFEPIAEEFKKKRIQTLNSEMQLHVEWLRKRAEEITGDSPAMIQAELFDPDIGRQSPDWVKETDPEKRLAAFGADRSNPTGKRNEADTALRIYRSRISDIESRLQLKLKEIIPIGLLMIMPEDK